ncbi:MAG: hypothetical protein C0601_01580 [Candidatus Muiribacterium halophilum]|uniref:Glycosyltransferase 2-like domain-containing protein n=1 Tax=Muiribacterium halophilum TaxID=2053465 RepID=A0A2N5ZLU2_MUIH1|nr:MAG: hypothetical protein C0601_01580 [Candidatus Muirbacterium halophilum]
MKDSISVIIPTFKRSFLLKQCLESIIASIESTTEIIVCDDSDDESCKEIVESFEYPDIKYIRCGGKGQGNARNIGARSSTGDYLLFIDSDVILFKDTIHRFKKHINKRHKIVLGNILFPEIPISHNNAITDLGYFFGNINDPKTNFIRFLPCLLLIKKELFIKNKGFDSEFAGYGFEDIELGYRICKNSKNILFDKKAKGLHYNNRTFDSIKKRAKKVAKASLLFFQKHPEYHNPYLLPIQRPFSEDAFKKSRDHILKVLLEKIEQNEIINEIIRKTDKKNYRRLKKRLKQRSIKFFNKISYYEIAYLSSHYNINLKLLPDTLLSRFISLKKINIKHLFKSHFIDNKKEITIDYYCCGVKKDIFIPGFDLFLLINLFLSKLF